MENKIVENNWCQSCYALENLKVNSKVVRKGITRVYYQCRPCYNKRQNELYYKRQAKKNA